jgi:hypothetical protein
MKINLCADVGGVEERKLLRGSSKHPVHYNIPPEMDKFSSKQRSLEQRTKVWRKLHEYLGNSFFVICFN